MSMNVVDLVNELCFLIIHSLLAVLAVNDQNHFLSSKGRETVGLVMIITCFGTLSVHVGMLLKEYYEALKPILKKISNLISNKKRNIHPQVSKVRLKKRIKRTRIIVTKVSV